MKTANAFMENQVDTESTKRARSGEETMLGFRPAKAQQQYDEILYQIAALADMHPGRGICLALTSTNPKEGVSFMTQELVSALGEHSPRRIRSVALDVIYDEASNYAARMAEKKIVEPVGYPENVGPVQTGVTLYRRKALKEMLADVDLLLIDCPPLRRGMRTLDVLSYVDGVLVVVQAGKTTKQDIIFAEKQILAAGGQLQGFILNRSKHG